MNTLNSFAALVALAFIFAALYFRPIRKTIGLLFIILGAIISLTFIGMIVGIPMIVVGGLLLFI
jgi:hypothetical protein